MGWQPGSASGPGACPDRDPRLGIFASEDGIDALVPSALLAMAADEVSGAGRRCPGASGDELVGLARAWAAIESWASAARHGVIAEMIRRDGALRKDGGWHGDLPDTWSPSLRHELALALACSVQSAETTTWLAWELQARLPGIGRLLNAGTLTMPKARAVIETFKFLTDADTARAEALILGRLAGKTYPQVLRLAEEAALTVDPGLAERRRLQAQKGARVTLFRELSGTAGLSGRDLPPDEALAAMAAVNARAQQYEDSGAFGATPADALRAYAYLDLLKGTPAEDRIACAVALDAAAEIAEAMAWANTRAARKTTQTRTGQGSSAEPAPEPGVAAQSEAKAAPWPETGPQHDARECLCDKRGDCPPGGCSELHDDTAGERPARCAGGRDNDADARSQLDDDGQPRFPEGDAGDDDNDEPHAPKDDGAPGPCGPDSPGSGGPGSGPGTSPGGRAIRLQPPDLIVPVTTLLGLAERPGEVQGFGLLDPALARDMAAAAAASPRTEICVTVTSPEGWAIGHGCAHPDRTTSSELTSPGGLPSRLNLTVPATALARLAVLARPAYPANPDHGARDWSFAPRGSTSPPRAARTSGPSGPPRGAGPPGQARPPTAARAPDGTALPDGYGTWTLVLPGGRRFTVRLDSVPTFSCDHRYASPGYHPGTRLRHLVQVRDGVCTFPTCNRHARDSDFEHAQSFETGGATCACNAGARSRACHRVKQSPGWQVTQQPKPGWHRWTTPSGRVYTQEPKRYLG